jgi:hypothetical protein
MSSRSAGHTSPPPGDAIVLGVLIDKMAESGYSDTT